MPRGAVLFAVFLTCLAAVAASGQTLYKIELRSGNSFWATERPVQNGPMLLFKRYPGGALMGLKAAEARRIVAVPRQAPARAASGGGGLKPGEQLVLGDTGGSVFAPPGIAARAAVPGRGTRPGEREDGTALFNPDREYRPDWDSKQVPGATIPYPASPNDYREGRTLAYPPASAVQSAPGQPPMMPPSGGEPPKPPNR